MTYEEIQTEAVKQIVFAEMRGETPTHVWLSKELSDTVVKRYVSEGRIINCDTGKPVQSFEDLEGVLVGVKFENLTLKTLPGDEPGRIIVDTCENPFWKKEWFIQLKRSWADEPKESNQP